MNSNAAAARPKIAVFWSWKTVLTGVFMLSGCGLVMDNEDRLDRSEAAYAEGDYRKAIIGAKDVLIDEPDNLRGRLILGRASIEVGDGAAAEKELRRALQLGAHIEEIAGEFGQALLLQGKFAAVVEEIPLEGLPGGDEELTVRVNHGDALMGLGNSAAAREVYRSVLQVKPDNLEARLGIVDSHVAEKNFLQARNEIDQVLDSHSNNERVWMYSGSFNMSMGDYEGANNNFRVAFDLTSDSEDVAAHLSAVAGIADSLIQLDDVDAARPHVAQLVSSRPDSLQTLMLSARVAYADQDWVVAQQTLQKVLQIARDFRPAQVLLGAVQLQSGNLGQAEMYLSSAVAARPDDVRARQLLAETQIQMQKEDEALKVLAPIVSAPDADSLSLHMAARASLGRRDTGDAVEFLRRSVDQYPANPDLKLQLAATLMRLGRTDEAQSVLESVDVGTSEDGAFRRDALNALMATGDDTDGALSRTRALTEKYSGRAEAFNLHGAVQLAGRDVASARRSFEAADKLNPGDTVSQQYLAAIEESEGDFSSAERRYREVLQSDPESAWANAALGRIASMNENHNDAVRYYQLASEAVPKNPEYRYFWAKAERDRGNGEQAESLLAEGDNGGLNHIPSAIMIGSLKVEAGDLRGAMGVATQLRNRYPDAPAAQAFLAEMHVLDGDLAAADRLYDTARSLGVVKSHALRAYRIKRELGLTNANAPLQEYLERRPLDSEIRVALAESFMQSNDLDSSISSYERVVSEQPDNAVALNNLAWAYFLAEDPRAIETARLAHQALPSNGAIVDTLGWIITQRGSAAEGEQLLRKAVEMENGRAEVRYHHAVALARLGRTDEARVALQQILEKEDEFSSRREAEQLLADMSGS